MRGCDYHIDARVSVIGVPSIIGVRMSDIGVRASIIGIFTSVIGVQPQVIGEFYPLDYIIRPES